MFLALLKTAFSSIVGLPVMDLKFRFDGRFCGDDDTPELMDMENEDMIEACLMTGDNWSDSDLYLEQEKYSVRTRERFTDQRLLVCTIIDCNSPSLLMHYLQENFGSILFDKDTADFTITCNGKNFLVHRAIISARSSVFRSMFNSNMEEARTGKMNIDNPPIDEKCLEELLHFIYTGRLSGKDFDIQAICFAADFYNLKGLVTAVCRKLEVGEARDGQVWYGRHDQVADMLIAGDIHNIAQLHKMAVQRIKINKAILTDKQFKEKMMHHPHVLFDLLQSSINNVQLFH